MDRFVKELLRAGAVAMTMVAANGALRTLPSCVRRRNVQVERIVVAVLTVLMLVAQDYVVHLHYCLCLFIPIEQLAPIVHIVYIIFLSRSILSHRNVRMWVVDS